MTRHHLQDRWLRTWERLGSTPSATAFARLLAAYSEPSRHYHDARHLEDTFAWLDQVAQQEPVPVEVELALWFHDVVYVSRAKDNEARSADWAVLELRAAVPKASDATSAKVAQLIMATKHSDAAVDEPSAGLLLDIDLSILGAPFARFCAYEREIRREYQWVPLPAYRAGRARVLDTFLRRQHIYATAFFRQRLEAQARVNLAWAKGQLASNALTTAVLRLWRRLFERK